MEVYGQETDIYFGEVTEREVDWRNEDIEDEDSDDELLEETPPDVVAMLGFDPREL